MNKKHVFVLGAKSIVGECVLASASPHGWQVTALSRRKMETKDPSVEWRYPDRETLGDENSPDGETKSDFISLTHIWTLPDYLAKINPAKIRRIVALSSTSRFTKIDSPDLKEQALALLIAESEKSLQKWAEDHGVGWVILRPTLMYGLGRDKNIAEIARFIGRFGFFPMFGKADGLRQPIHVEDVASACIAALQAPCAANRAYNLSGGETLPYRDMVIRVFAALDRSPILIPVPLSAFRIAVTLLRTIPRYRQWSSSMATRMNKDMVFDHNEASRDLAFKPRAFLLSAKDVVPSVRLDP